MYWLRIGGRSVLLVIAGAGTGNAYRAAQAMARSFPLCGLASVGFAGGLVPELAAGDVIVADRIVDENTGEKFDCDPDLLPGRFNQRGGVVCAPTVVASSSQKLQLGSKWTALAVDMESAGVARAARTAGLPFCAVKSITDSAEQSLFIDFNCCRSEDKDFSLRAIAWQGLTTFKGAGELWRLARSARQAAGTLAAALVAA